eukprot:4392402-Lingulodinium_polyedra.AAC.1
MASRRNSKNADEDPPRPPPLATKRACCARATPCPTPSARHAAAAPGSARCGQTRPAPPDAR